MPSPNRTCGHGFSRDSVDEVAFRHEVGPRRADSPVVGWLVGIARNLPLVDEHQIRQRVQVLEEQCVPRTLPTTESAEQGVRRTPELTETEGLGRNGLNSRPTRIDEVVGRVDDGVAHHYVGVHGHDVHVSIAGIPVHSRRVGHGRVDGVVIGNVEYVGAPTPEDVRGSVRSEHINDVLPTGDETCRQFVSIPVGRGPVPVELVGHTDHHRLTVGGALLGHRDKPLTTAVTRGVVLTTGEGRQRCAVGRKGNANPRAERRRPRGPVRP